MDINVYDLVTKFQIEEKKIEDKANEEEDEEEKDKLLSELKNLIKKNEDFINERKE